MASASLQLQGEELCACHDRPGGDSEPTDGLVVPEMERQGLIDMRGFEDAVPDHHLISAHPLITKAFLARLEAELQSSRKLSPVGVQEPGHSQADGRVSIVSASMHDAGRLRGILGAGLLQDGQGIHVEPEQEGWARLPTFQQSHDAGLADALRHLQAEILELARPRSRQSEPRGNRALGACGSRAEVLG